MKRMLLVLTVVLSLWQGALIAQTRPAAPAITLISIFAEIDNAPAALV